MRENPKRESSPCLPNASKLFARGVLLFFGEKRKLRRPRKNRASQVSYFPSWEFLEFRFDSSKHNIEQFIKIALIEGWMGRDAPMRVFPR